jgi:hypothetical protein
LGCFNNNQFIVKIKTTLALGQLIKTCVAIP